MAVNGSFVQWCCCWFLWWLVVVFGGGYFFFCEFSSMSLSLMGFQIFRW